MTMFLTSTSQIFIFFFNIKHFSRDFKDIMLSEKIVMIFWLWIVFVTLIKTDLTTITMLQSFSILFRGKLSSELKLIFIYFSS